MFGRTALKILLLSLSIGISGPGLAEERGSSAYLLQGSSDIAAIFNATCASGKITAAGLQGSFKSQGFISDWQDDTYGYFTRVGFTANYHIYPGSWNCFVSVEGAAAPDLCEVLPPDGMEVNARLPDGTCVASIPKHGLTVLVRNICPDSSYGTCTWIQATLTSDRECYGTEVVDLAFLTRDFLNTN